MDFTNDMYWVGFHLSVHRREGKGGVAVTSSSSIVECNTFNAESISSSIDEINAWPRLSRFPRLTCHRKNGSIRIRGCRIQPPIHRSWVLNFSPFGEEDVCKEEVCWERSKHIPTSPMISGKRTCFRCFSIGRMMKVVGSVEAPSCVWTCQICLQQISSVPEPENSSHSRQ